MIFVWNNFDLGSVSQLVCFISYFQYTLRGVGGWHVFSHRVRWEVIHSPGNFLGWDCLFVFLFLLQPRSPCWSKPRRKSHSTFLFNRSGGPSWGSGSLFFLLIFLFWLFSLTTSLVFTQLSAYTVLAIRHQKFRHEMLTVLGRKSGTFGRG